MFRIIVLVSLIFSIFSCGEGHDLVIKKIDKSFLEDNNISNKDKLLKVLEKDYLNFLGFNKQQQDAVISFYSANGNNFKQFDKGKLSSFGKLSVDCLEKPLQFGVPESRLISMNKNGHWIEKEVIMTCNLLSIGGLIKNGIVDFKLKSKKSTTTLDGREFHRQLKQLDTISLANLIIKQGPSDTNYMFIATHLFEFCKRFPIDTGTFSLKSKKEDTLNFEKNIRECLEKKGFLKKKSSDEDLNMAIRTFKKYCGYTIDSKIDEATLTAMNESTYNKVLRTALAMDKLRQQIKKENKHIRINLPSFELLFYSDDTLRSTHRIIIGKTVNPTPELSARINSIVCYPYWKVPQSIADKEILPAVKANVGYLSKNQYRIFRDKKEVEPSTVAWRRYSTHFPYTIIQDPGPKNSLGIIKLEFYNSYNVYVHDTPSKSLFRRSFRSFSHGCMRCENPVELAKIILDFDSISPRNRNVYVRDSIDSVLYRAKNFKIPLKRNIPIYIEYLTVSATREHLFFHIDLYKRDDEYIKIMIGA